MWNKETVHEAVKPQIWIKIWHLLLLGTIFFILSVVLGRLAVKIISIFLLINEENLLFNICQSMALALLVILWQKKIAGLTWQEIGFCRLDSRKIAISIASGAAICLFLLFMASIEQTLTDKMTTQTLIATAERADSFVTIVQICILSVIVAPISEEIMFRGFFYRGFQAIIGKNAGIILCAFLFGVLHFDFYRLLSLTLAGMVLNILREKYASLYASMLAHGVWNALMLGLVFWF